MNKNRPHWIVFFLGITLPIVALLFLVRWVSLLPDDNNTQTLRMSEPTLIKDPSTRRDERENEPIGKLKADFVHACNQDSEICYDLRADLFGSTIVRRLYLPEGGWVDIDYYADCNYSNCLLRDENGTNWIIDFYSAKPLN